MAIGSNTQLQPQKTSARIDAQRAEIKVNAKSYILGLITGLLASILLIVLVFDRYEVTSGGPEGVLIIKNDRWTGRTWISTLPNARTRLGTDNYLWDEIGTGFIAPAEDVEAARQGRVTPFTGKTDEEIEQERSKTSSPPKQKNPADSRIVPAPVPPSDLPEHLKK